MPNIACIPATGPPKNETQLHDLSLADWQVFPIGSRPIAPSGCTHQSFSTAISYSFLSFSLAREAYLDLREVVENLTAYDVMARIYKVHWSDSRSIVRLPRSARILTNGSCLQFALADFHDCHEKRNIGAATTTNPAKNKGPNETLRSAIQGERASENSAVTAGMSRKKIETKPLSFEVFVSETW